MPAASLPRSSPEAHSGNTHLHTRPDSLLLPGHFHMLRSLALDESPAGLAPEGTTPSPPQTPRVRRLAAGNRLLRLQYNSVYHRLLDERLDDGVAVEAAPVSVLPLRAIHINAVPEALMFLLWQSVRVPTPSRASGPLLILSSDTSDTEERRHGLPFVPVHLQGTAAPHQGVPGVVAVPHLDLESDEESDGFEGGRTEDLTLNQLTPAFVMPKMSVSHGSGVSHSPGSHQYLYTVPLLMEMLAPLMALVREEDGDEHTRHRQRQQMERQARKSLRYSKLDRVDPLQILLWVEMILGDGPPEERRRRRRPPLRLWWVLWAVGGVVLTGGLWCVGVACGWIAPPLAFLPPPPPPPPPPQAPHLGALRYLRRVLVALAASYSHDFFAEFRGNVGQLWR